MRHLPRRMRSDGLETVNVRTSRGTTVPVTTPYYREKHARRAKRRPGLYPALVVLTRSTTGATPKLASDRQAARSPCSARWPKRRRSSVRRHRPGYQDPPLDRLSLRCAGPSGPAERGVRSAGPRDRQAGGRLPRRGPRPRRKKRGPKTKKGRNRPTGRNRSSVGGSDVGPGGRTYARQRGRVGSSSPHRGGSPRSPADRCWPRNPRTCAAGARPNALARGLLKRAHRSRPCGPEAPQLRVAHNGRARASASGAVESAIRRAQHQGRIHRYRASTRFFSCCLFRQMELFDRMTRWV